MPAWLGWLGAVIALVLLVALAGVFTDDVDAGLPGSAGAIGFLLHLVWVLAASVVLLRKGGDRVPRRARCSQPQTLGASLGR